MNINFNGSMFDLNGSLYKENNQAMSVGAFVCGLLTLSPVDPNLDPILRARRFSLSLRIATTKTEIDVDDDDMTMIRDLLNKSTLPPLYSEQIRLVLDGKPNPLAALQSKPSHLSVVKE